MILSNDGLVAFHYRSYGTFFLHKNRLHNIYRGFTHYKYYRAFLLGIEMRVIIALVKKFRWFYCQFSVDFLVLIPYRQDYRIIIYKLPGLTFLMEII